MSSRSVEIRRGRPDDIEPCFDVFLESVTDLTVRQGNVWEADPATIWTRLEPLYRMLSAHAAEWWVAQDSASGRLVGYARSVERGGLFELAEFFVRPGNQSAGVGGQLLERAFPADRGDVRAIIATTDVRALARYYRAGTVARFPIVSLSAPPTATPDAADLEVVRASATDADQLAALERDVLGYARGPEELSWLFEQREGHLYRRNGVPVGFGFVSRTGNGPIALLDAHDMPAVLTHLEARAGALGVENVSFEVPMVNEAAMRHLLGRGYRMDPFLTLLLTSRPFGQFDRYICFSPPFVL